MQEKLEKIFVKRFMVVDSSFLSSSLGFDLILRFSVSEPQTGGAFCGSDPPYSCCAPNAQGGCDCSASRCSGGKLIYLPKYFRTTLARNNPQRKWAKWAELAILFS